MSTAEQTHYKNLFSKISAIALLVAVVPVWPYFFYQLLKFLIFGTAAYSAYVYHSGKNKKWMWVMIIVAIIFNPINPFYFGHFLWSVVDLIVAAIFFKSLKLRNAPSS